MGRDTPEQRSSADQKLIFNKNKACNVIPIKGAQNEPPNCKIRRRASSIDVVDDIKKLTRSSRPFVPVLSRQTSEMHRRKNCIRNQNFPFQFQSAIWREVNLNLSEPCSEKTPHYSRHVTYERRNLSHATSKVTDEIILTSSAGKESDACRVFVYWIYGHLLHSKISSDWLNSVVKIKMRMV